MNEPIKFDHYINGPSISVWDNWINDWIKKNPVMIRHDTQTQRWVMDMKSRYMAKINFE